MYLDMGRNELKIQVSRSPLGDDERDTVIVRWHHDCYPIATCHMTPDEAATLYAELASVLGLLECERAGDEVCLTETADSIALRQSHD